MNSKRTAIKNLNVGDYFSRTPEGPQFNRVSAVTVGMPGEGTRIAYVTPSGLAGVFVGPSLEDVYVI